MLRLLSPVAAAVLLIVAVWQAPHTVHHLMEEGSDGDPGCPVATSAERAQATAPAVVVLIQVDAADFRVHPGEQPAAPAPPLVSFPARAPPFAV
jgi:hypothetical protein